MFGFRRTAGANSVARDQWFKHLFGFSEPSGQQGVWVNPSFIHERLELIDDGRTLRSKVNGAKYGCGSFTTPSLAELRDAVARGLCVQEQQGGHHLAGRKLEVHHVGTRDVFELHADNDYNHATFMAASQFNCLEFPNQDCVPGTSTIFCTIV